MMSEMDRLAWLASVVAETRDSQPHLQKVKSSETLRISIPSVAKKIVLRALEVLAGCFSPLAIGQVGKIMSPTLGPGTQHELPDKMSVQVQGMSGYM